MKLTTVFLLLLTVTGISSGQMLFKHGAISLSKLYKPWDLIASPPIMVGVSIYAVSTLLWIYLLREVALSKAYPFLALSFVIVPLPSRTFFDEHLDSSYLAGMLLIVAGVVLITR
ncbi:MAG: EamA family transporter [Gallionella sp.]